MKICNIGKIITEKIDGSTLTHDNYISTENMMSNCGGVVAAASVPSTKVTCFAKCDVLLSNIRPYFKKVWFARFNGGCSNDVICIRANEKDCLAQYLYYALSTDSFIDSFSASSKGTKMPRGDKNALLSYEIPDRTLDEQQHIVDILGSIDDSIENNEFLIKKTNDFLADLFLKYSAKATDYKRLDEICSIITKGTTPTTLKRSFVDYGVPFVKVESLTDSHQIDTNKLAFIDTETHEMLQRSKLKYKDLLISIAGTIGRFALVPKTMPQANTNQAVALVRGSIVSQEYLYALFLSESCDEQIKAKTVQAVQANLSLSVIGSLSVPYILDNTFNKQINSLYEYIENLAEKNNKLYELKQLYLHKFFG